MYKPHFFNSFIHRGTLRLFPHLGSCEHAAMNMGAVQREMKLPNATPKASLGITSHARSDITGLFKNFSKA